MDATPTSPARPDAGSCAIAVMAKASAPGRTKTRLVPPLTHDEAAALNTAFLQDMACKMQRAGRASSIAPYMAFGPTGSEPFFRSILPKGGIGMIDAWLPDFGHCLLHGITTMLEAGHTSACVLNADSPTLPPAYLVEAAVVLALPGDRAVLGPSTDGGYYLLGMKQAHQRLFASIDWSTEVVAEQTLDRAREIGLPLHVLPTWYDVDDADTLRAVIADLSPGSDRNGRASAPDGAEATAALIGRLDRDRGLLARLGLAPKAALMASDPQAMAGVAV